MKLLPSEIFMSTNTYVTLDDIVSHFQNQTIGGKAKKTLPLYSDPEHVITYETQCKGCKTPTLHEPGVAIREKRYVLETRCSCCRKKKTHEVPHTEMNNLPTV